MPDEVIEVYLSTENRRPYYVAQWVVMYLAMFFRYYKTPKPYSFFDPFKKAFKPKKRSKKDIDELNRRMDRIKREGKKVTSNTFNL